MMKKLLILLTLIFLPMAVQAFDIYGYMGNPEKPLSIAKPDWVDEKSHLRLGYEVEEIYKEWRDNVRLVDYSGNTCLAELQANPVEHFAFGLVKRFDGDQTWINRTGEDTRPFNMHSSNRLNGAFLKLGSDHFKVMYCRSESKENFRGHFDLHEDIIAALGDDPDESFDTDGTSDVFKAYGEHKRFKVSLRAESTRYKHRVLAPSEELRLTLNHDRKVKVREAELSYDTGRHWFPYIRFYSYRDTGDGRDYRFSRDYRYPSELRFGTGKLYGENQTNIKVTTKTIGAAYEYKHGWYYADYSRVSADLYGHIFFNLVNVDPLFLFSTRYSEGTTWFKPDTGHMGRIGFKRHHRSIQYGMQYSLCKLHGDVGRISEKTRMGGVKTETSENFKDLRLHRLDISAVRPDKNGSWSIGLKAMFPQLKTHKDGGHTSGGGGGGGGGRGGHEPHKDIRGGWQITVMREFKL